MSNREQELIQTYFAPLAGDGAAAVGVEQAQAEGALPFTLHGAGLDFHLSLEEIRAHRDDFDCGRLVLTHLGDAMSAKRGQLEIETADDGMAGKL